ncbi:MAG TPA: sulfite exporter TauE/SafE family protein [Gaiellaceae bacterium]|nr:sulfite exporter TauE/SafE family protein [Gaiellaceae bacterium]
MWWEYTLSGLLVGGLVGMTGMGGGSLMTPILVILFGVSPATAVGTDIAHGAVFKTVGALQHRRLGNVRAQLAGWMFLGSAPMSLVGVWLASWLEHAYGKGVESTMGRVLGGALLFGCVGLVAKSVVSSKAIEDDDFALTARDRAAAVLIGLFGGFVVGLTSVGSGVFFGLTLLVVFPLRAHKVVGTDIFHAAALLYVAGVGHVLAGNVDLGIVGWLLLGSVPGVLAGGRLSVSVGDGLLRFALAAVLGLSGLKLIDVPGTGTAVVVLLAFAMAALLTYLGRHSWVRYQDRRNGRAAVDAAVSSPAAPAAAAAGRRRSAGR